MCVCVCVLTFAELALLMQIYRNSFRLLAILEKSELSFLKAVEIAKKSAKPSNLLRMAATFNLSVFYYEVHRDAKKAIGMAREVSMSANTFTF